jgi:hypothetical protein
VRKTLHHATDLLDLYPAAVRVVQRPRRERVLAALAGRDPIGDDLETLLPAFEAVWAELMSARDDLVAAGAVPARCEGTVVQLNRSGGGVPKLPVEGVEVDHCGVVGDSQSSRLHHGRPWQALCIWSREVIDSLAGEGHPIHPGAAGENVTTAGLAWADVRPGVHLRLGSVLCEVSAFALPCFNLKPFFSDADFRRIHHDRGPISRVYATVLMPGTIATGDAAVLEP